jgi:carboxymethylenebutenolidase
VRVLVEQPLGGQEVAEFRNTADFLFRGRAGHGFLRQQDGRDGANLRAARAAWPRTIAFLRVVLGR